jgi:septal ring factor EnvC (AmiA/AmiB activator)
MTSMESRSSESREQAAGSGQQLAAYCLLTLAYCLLPAACGLLTAQAPDRARTEALARRVAERIETLQREADQLAREAQTLVGDLRKLEIERDIQNERLTQAEADVAVAQAALQETTERLARLEQERVAALPDLQARLVEMYKQGRGGYARMLLNVRDLREFGRATRAVSALAHINERRVAEHRETLAALRTGREALEARTRDLQATKAAAETARAAAERAIAARTALVARIDRRRDLTAQFAGELQLAQARLAQAVSDLAAGRTVEQVSVPIAPFRGALDWPVVGRVARRFGQSSGQQIPEAGSHGIDIAAPPGTPVRAVHPGTVGYADSFVGYGTLVIVDHGGNQYSLYGYLSAASVERGQRVEAGDQLGRVGSAPSGASALYFEMRVDGRSVDPVQWLKPR